MGKDFDFYGQTAKVSDAINEEQARFTRQQVLSKPAGSVSAEPVAKSYKTGYEVYRNSRYIPDLKANASLWGGESEASSRAGAPQSSQHRDPVAASSKKMMSLEEVEASMAAQSNKSTASQAPRQIAQVLPPTTMQPQLLSHHSVPVQSTAQHQTLSQHNAPVQSSAQHQLPLQPKTPAQYSIQHFPPQHNMSVQSSALNTFSAQHSMPAQSLAPHQLTAQHNVTAQSSAQTQVYPTEQNVNHVTGAVKNFKAEISGTPMMAPRTSHLPNPSNPPQILQRGQPLPQQGVETHEPTQPLQILQNTTRQQARLAPRAEPSILSQQSPQLVHPGSVYVHKQAPIIAHPQQLMHLAEEERAAFLVEDAKRAKRNHKIFLLSKDNGLMTPQDKNFVTRIQLQQLMTATGNVTEHDPDAALSEDFYYQVHNQIRGGPRQNPHQPLSNFAQTYLFQTGSRQGGMARRQNRGGDNHTQRMEQQVQRAVEAAKLKPKNKQLVIEGSLGKISFSNAKTPKPLLNMKRSENIDTLRRPQTAERKASGKKPSSAPASTSDRKAILRNIETVYSILMKMEDHERRLPPRPADEGDHPRVQPYVEWHATMQKMNQDLWKNLKVMEPIVHESPILHPFIAFLSYPKGKKAVPRIFRHIDLHQRLTILTMIVIHLNVLDVIRHAQPRENEAQLPITTREEVELFSQAVMPNLFAFVNEAPLEVVIGLIGLILDRVNIKAIARTKVGLNILTMLISRVELLKQAEAPKDEEWNQWLDLYNRLFDAIEPLLKGIFPGSINAGQDEYVWRFLAASGIGASPDQQQRLVIGVK